MSSQLIVAAVALCAVLALILLLSRFARMIPGLLPAKSALGGAPMLRGTVALDSRRRLHLVEIEGRQALVLTGGATDSVVCLPPAAASAPSLTPLTNPLP